MGLYKLDAMSNYSKKLKDPRWQKKRLEIMNRDDFTCQHCFDETKPLNVHHMTYSNVEPWEYTNNNLITICDDCHKLAHSKDERVALTIFLKLWFVLFLNNKIEEDKNE